MSENNSIKLFEEKQIRTAWDEKEEKWYFSVSDVVEALSESRDVKQYIKKMRSRDPELNLKWGTICTPVPMIAADGKTRKITATDTEGLLRIIQSIPSKKAEPFKLWLARVGRERIDEIVDPEYGPAEIKEIVADAIKDLYENDHYLLDLGNGDVKEDLGCKLQRHAGERAIMFRFAYYLQNRLQSPEHVVDCEYNRNLYNVKTLGQKAIIPDVIIHQRGNNEHNLLAIEIKPWWNENSKYDAWKLRGLTGGAYHYRYGLWLCFGREQNETKWEWFRGGRQVNKGMPFRAADRHLWG